MNNHLIDSYSYVNRQVKGGIYVNNNFHNYMFNHSKNSGILIDILGDTDTFNSQLIGDIQLDVGGLDTVISRANMEQLKVLGLKLTPDFHKKHRTSLVSSYFLNSSLCYLEIEKRSGKEMFFVTKSYDIIMSLIDKIYQADIKKLQGLKAQMVTTVEELKTGVFNVITLSPDLGGFRLNKAKINTNKKGVRLNTAYNIGFYSDRIIRHLRRNKANIYYKEDGEEKVLTTSLFPKLVSRWAHTNNKNIVKQVVENTQDIYCLANIILPNLKSQRELVTINSLSITNIKKCN